MSTYVAPEDRKMLFYRCLAGFLSISFAFYAVSQMVLADASVIVFTSPVFTFFLVGLTSPVGRTWSSAN
jgi:drug/metabolite transporter (DMT)-like permease